jgi:hypothetical protein
VRAMSCSDSLHVSCTRGAMRTLVLVTRYVLVASYVLWCRHVLPRSWGFVTSANGVPFPVCWIGAVRGRVLCPRTQACQREAKSVVHSSQSSSGGGSQSHTAPRLQTNTNTQCGTALVRPGGRLCTTARWEGGRAPVGGETPHCWLPNAMRGGPRVPPQAMRRPPCGLESSGASPAPNPPPHHTHTTRTHPVHLATTTCGHTAHMLCEPAHGAGVGGGVVTGERARGGGVGQA